MALEDCSKAIIVEPLPSKGHFGISFVKRLSFSQRLKCTNAMGKGPKERPLLGGCPFFLEDPLLEVL